MEKRKLSEEEIEMLVDQDLISIPYEDIENYEFFLVNGQLEIHKKNLFIAS